MKTQSSTNPYLQRVIDRQRRLNQVPLLDANLEKLVDEFSTLYNIPKNTVRVIVTSPFMLWKELVTEQLENLDENALQLPVIRIPGFGTFGTYINQTAKVHAEKKANAKKQSKTNKACSDSTTTTK